MLYDRRYYNPTLDYLQKRQLDLMNPMHPDRDEKARARRLQQLKQVDKEIADYNHRQCMTTVYVSVAVFLCLVCICVCFIIFMLLAALSANQKTKKGNF